ncbi:MAG: sigma-70 family RNA polymerase sigma factor [Planctomycetota bacterium]|nr:sigma-70 family RNA polymerase sigma factor [Planctomycetota bacterium]
MIEPSVEARLVADLQGRDRRARDRALDELFGLVGRPLFQLCLRVTCRPADAEDAVQETFIDVLRGVDGFRADARLTTWLFRVAIRAALRVKSRGERGERVSARAFDDVEMEERAAPATGGERDPATLAAEREGAARVLSAIARLPAAQRTVLGLAALDELPRAQIAEILGVPIGTVDSRLHAARDTLRAELERGQRPTE